MATSNLQTQKPFSVLLFISLTSFLLLLNKVNSSTESTSFTFPKFVPDQKNLIFQRDAVATSTGELQLTKVENGVPIYFSLGRALYSAPVHIWDNTTGNVASFNTSFSFVIYAPHIGSAADGLAFFLAPEDTQPREPGGFLGIFGNQIYNKSVVAVEFDTCYNIDWDPRGRHIGIDVNSIKSIKTTSWDFANYNGEVANVVISYQASTKTLTAVLAYPSRGTSSKVSAAVDLKEALPEWVRVGFSATTGINKGNVQTNNVLSWSFNSELPGVGNSDALENTAHLTSHMLHDSM